IAQANTVALVNLSNNDLGVGSWELGGGAALPTSNSQFPTPFPLPDTLFAPPDLFGGQLKRLVDDIVGRLRDGEQVIVVTPQAARVQELVEESLRTKSQEPRTDDDDD